MMIMTHACHLLAALILAASLVSSLPSGNIESSSSMSSAESHTGYTPSISTVQDIAAHDLERSTKHPSLLRYGPNRFTHEEDISDRVRFSPSDPQEGWTSIDYCVYKPSSRSFLTNHFSYSGLDLDPDEHFPARVRARQEQRLQDWNAGKYAGREGEYMTQEHNDIVMMTAMDYLVRYRHGGIIIVPFHDKLFYSPYIRPEIVAERLQGDRSGRKRLPVLHKDLETGRWYFILYPGRHVFIN